jgi:hypothetical protein
MNKTTEALKLAEEALESCDAGDYSTGHVIHPSFNNKTVDEALAAIREALAEQIPEWVDVDDYEEPVKQEPVAWVNEHGMFTTIKNEYGEEWLPLYAAPVDAKAILETERKRHAFELSMQEELFADNAKAIRAEALEEAAKVCDEEAKSWARLNAQDEEGYGASQCAAAIRGLK